METLPRLLALRALERPAQDFLFFRDLRFTFRQLDEWAGTFAAALEAAGVQHGDRVALLTGNCPEFLAAFFGAQRAGAIAVPVNPALKAPEVEFILADAGCVALVADGPRLPVAAAVRPRCPALRTLYAAAVEGADGRDAGPTLRFPEPSPAGRAACKAAGPAPDDLAAIIYTSGTTGRPKGVMLTHASYLYDASAIAAWVRMTPEDRFLCILPLFHVNAQVVTTLAPLVAGASLVLLERFSPAEFLDALDRYRATAFSAVPTVYAILNALPEDARRDLSRLRLCVCGAAPMPVEVFAAFEKRFRAFLLEGYGLSEGTCASSVNPLDGPRKIGSIGLPLPGQELAIVDDQDRPVPTGEVGEIVVRGPNVMRGYWNNPAATAETLRGGRLHTGDLGRVDADGYYFIAGRKKEMIIRGGENIYPREIEEVLHRHAGVAEAAVVGVPDAVWGEEVGAVVVPRSSARPPAEPPAPLADPLRAELEALCRAALADYKCPRRWFELGALPRTATGKVQKHVLAARLSPGER
ncbi:MAG: long-chain fatty acid--CoA ligase [Planctomycetes bacterium]|nr:long-chain fatty acid--CoA ligase [Planctomycetota bacterium]